jgi:hypothetical protein
MAEDVSIDVESSQFIGNVVNSSGGSIYLTCSLQNIKGCDYNINMNTIANNSAQILGGAIYYDLYSPENI